MSELEALLKGADVAFDRAKEKVYAIFPCAPANKDTLFNESEKSLFDALGGSKHAGLVSEGSIRPLYDPDTKAVLTTNSLLLQLRFPQHSAEELKKAMSAVFGRPEHDIPDMDLKTFVHKQANERCDLTSQLPNLSTKQARGLS